MGKKTCVITGVGWGTGNAIARKFANSGYSVAMLARRGDRLEQLESEIENAHAFPCDVTDTTALKETLKKIVLPNVNDFVQPILYALPVQLIAYYVAVRKGTDVDQPRNLAKSVTVE